MPILRHTILVLLLPAAGLLFGQSFQKEYAPVNGGFVIPYGAALRPDGKFLVSHMVNDDSIRLYVTCLEPDGAVAWSVSLQAHPDIAGNEGFVEGPIVATADNGCIVMVSKSYQSQVVQQGWALVKLGPDGTVQWNRQIAGVGLVDDFLKYSGTRTYAAARYPPSPYKRYLACLTDDGAVLWEKDLSCDLGIVTVSNTQAISGQRILLMLGTENATLSAGHLAALDEGGNIAHLVSLPEFNFMDAVEHPDGRLFFLGNNAGKMMLGVLLNGQILWVKILGVPADSYFSGFLALNNMQDSLLVSFQGIGFKEQRLLLQFDLAGNFAKGHYLPSREVNANEVLDTPDGGLAWASFSKTSPLRAFVFVKTNPEGRLNSCPVGLLCRVGVRDTSLQELPPPVWKTENVANMIVRAASGQHKTIHAADYCAPLPPFDAVIFAADSVACTGEVLPFYRDSLTTGVSTWLFQGGVPTTFYGPEPPGVAYPDSGAFTIYHILEQAGCRDTAGVSIRIEPKPDVVLPPDTLICAGSIAHITPSGAADWQYHWNDATVGTTYDTYLPGTYSVTVTNAGGCTDAESIRIGSVGFPRKPLPADTFSCENAPVSIQISTAPGWQYTWTDGFPEPDREILVSGMYVLLADSPEGCRLEDSVRVEITECPECFVYFPNVIQPNSGGENGLFSPQTGCAFSDFSMRIFDRWGALVFDGRDATQSWDGSYRGKPVQPGVYTFAVNGKMYSGQLEIPFARFGTVAVVR